MKETPISQPISPELQRIARMAKNSPTLAFRTLAHHITPDLLKQAVHRTRKDGAPGIDGQVGTDYLQRLDSNIASLWQRLRTECYRAPAVRRVYIPKPGNKRRPLGIPTFEDKVVQRAAVMVLEQIYEQDFLPSSFGFRPRRSAHSAIAALREGMTGGGWVLDADIRDFFGTLNHAQLREILRRRVADGALLRLIGKWLKAGVLEEGRLTRSKTGTPQGGIVSPLLSNTYLHEVLDKWFEHDVRPLLRGRAFLVRYADDFVVVFSDRWDAERVLEVLPKRFARYGLTLHPEKTRLVQFRRPSGQERPGTFDFLGFTHFWGRTRHGNMVIKRKTASRRLSRALRSVNTWCSANRHRPLAEQQRTLSRKLRGHCAYYGITGNSRALATFKRRMQTIWRKWLCRRSNAARKPWGWYEKILRAYPLPPARAVHSALARPAKP